MPPSQPALPTLVLALACTGCGAAPRPAAPAPVAAPFSPQALECAPAEVPASLMIERAGEADRAAARFEETRSVVLTTLGLYLGTGRWAESARIVGAARPARAGSEDECRTLRAVAAGRTPPSWVPGAPQEPLAVAGVVGLAYLPSQGGRPPRLHVRLAGLLVQPDGSVLRAAPAEVTADYATLTPRFHERNPQEVAQELTERAARTLAQAIR